jgi:hypothetical protein
VFHSFLFGYLFIFNFIRIAVFIKDIDPLQPPTVLGILFSISAGAVKEKTLLPPARWSIKVLMAGLEPATPEL